MPNIAFEIARTTPKSGLEIDLAEAKKYSPAVKAFIRWLSENRKEVLSKHFPTLETF